MRGMQSGVSRASMDFPHACSAVQFQLSMRRALYYASSWKVLRPSVTRVGARRMKWDRVGHVPQNTLKTCPLRVRTVQWRARGGVPAAASKETHTALGWKQSKEYRSVGTVEGSHD